MLDRATSDQKAVRACGPCSLCCKLFEIEELAKPRNRWCAHCRPGHGGCTIYDRRPQVCRDFECLWLADQSLGPEWQPMRSKIVLGMAHGLLIVSNDPAYPDAWRQPPYVARLKRYAAEGFAVMIVSGDRRLALFTDGEVPFGEDGNAIGIVPAHLARRMAAFSAMLRARQRDYDRRSVHA